MMNLFSIPNIMIVLHTDNVDTLNTCIESGKKVFILFYMDGCGPCNATRPEWKKLENVLTYGNDVVVADVEQGHLSHVKHLKHPPQGFPAMLMITNHGKTQQYYEDSQVRDKNRTVDSFVEWVKLNMKKSNLSKSRRMHKRGGKWSRKYKKSVNCKKPKGFSQKQYCKYGRATAVGTIHAVPRSYNRTHFFS